MLTGHQVEHVSFLIRPVKPQHLDLTREHGVRFDPIEDVETAVQILPDVIVVFTEIEVECMEYNAHGDVSVEGRHEKPCAKMITWDEAGNALPYFRWRAMGSRLVYEMDLRGMRVGGLRSLGRCKRTMLPLRRYDCRSRLDGSIFPTA